MLYLLLNVEVWHELDIQESQIVQILFRLISQLFELLIGRF